MSLDTARDRKASRSMSPDSPITDFRAEVLEVGTGLLEGEEVLLIGVVTVSLLQGVITVHPVGSSLLVVFIDPLVAITSTNQASRINIRTVSSMADLLVGAAEALPPEAVSAPTLQGDQGI